MKGDEVMKELLISIFSLVVSIVALVISILRVL
nr:MAG TPA: hypothetical protein [Caudoviricetes sp.]